MQTRTKTDLVVKVKVVDMINVSFLNYTESTRYSQQFYTVEEATEFIREWLINNLS